METRHIWEGQNKGEDAQYFPPPLASNLHLQDKCSHVIFLISVMASLGTEISSWGQFPSLDG